MIDESFTEGYKYSYDNKLVLRLFRLPDVDGQMRFSFEVIIRDGGYVFYKLPETFWMDTSDQLDWCTDCNILFFTVLHLKKAFIYDVTYMNQVSCDLRPSDTVRWDETGKMWCFFGRRVSSIQGDNSKNLSDKDYLKLPYPSDTPQADFKVLPTQNPRYSLVLNKVPKINFFEPDLWTIGIVDIEKKLWVVEELPYHIMDDAVRFSKYHFMDCYGLNHQHNCCVLFRFDCDKIPDKEKLEVFVNDFSPTYPEKVVWDEEDRVWRAVIKGEVIYPRPFYFDNMYIDELPIVSKPIPLPVLQQLTKSE